MSNNNSEVHIFEEEGMQQHIDDSAIIPQQQHYNNNNENNEEEETVLPIDFIHDRFPYCIVWTPIPLITWLLPFVGHMGIATSEGIIHDFAGPYYISVDNFSFGRPTKYLSLQSLFPDKQFTSKELDEAIKNSKKCYRKLMYNFFCNNCHHFVANVLNQLNLRRTDFTIVELGFYLFFYGKFIGISGVLKTFLPFCILTLLSLFFWIKIVNLF
ncbi:hypothetical protein ABK040_007272 [Willaertia magna]